MRVLSAARLLLPLLQLLVVASASELLLGTSDQQERQLRRVIHEAVGEAVRQQMGGLRCSQTPPLRKRQASEASLQGGASLQTVADEIAEQLEEVREDLGADLAEVEQSMQEKVAEMASSMRQQSGSCTCAPNLERLELGIQEQYDNLLQSVVDVAEIAIGTQQAVRQQLTNITLAVADLAKKVSAVSGPPAGDPDMRLALLSDTFYRFVNISRRQMDRVISSQARSASLLQVVADRTLSPPPQPPCGGPARDCADLRRQGFRNSGVYVVRPELGRPRLVSVYCDMETAGGGWTVVQRRADVDAAQHVNFFRGWNEYRHGFGNRSGEFWAGNEMMHQLTLDRTVTLRLDMTDLEGEKRYAEYTGFAVASEPEQYRLRIGQYSGTAGDGLGRAHGVGFTTHDRDNDQYSSGNCAQLYKGGWWYDACHNGNPNGLYLRGEHGSYADGVNWRFWRGYHYSMPHFEIKLRPTGFKPPS